MSSSHLSRYTRPVLIYPGLTLRNTSGRWKGACLEVLRRADGGPNWIVRSETDGSQREVTENTLMHDYELWVR